MRAAARKLFSVMTGPRTPNGTRPNRSTPHEMMEAQAALARKATRRYSTIWRPVRASMGSLLESSPILPQSLYGTSP